MALKYFYEHIIIHRANFNSNLRFCLFITFFLSRTYLKKFIFNATNPNYTQTTIIIVKYRGYHLNKLILIVPVLILIIAVSGCTYEDRGPGVNNIYNDSKIYFEYPHEYTIKEVNSTNGTFVEGVSGWDYNCTFKISKEPLDSTGRVNGISLNDLKNTAGLTSANYTVEEVQNITINGTQALDMIYAHYSVP